jgi:hypothetical protein
LKNTKKGIVLLDGFEYLIVNYEFEPCIQFLQLTRNRFEENNGILIIPILEGALEERQFKLLERELKLLKIDWELIYRDEDSERIAHLNTQQKSDY